jgi:predicted metal-dependent HD superfamily phosphohydrolase
MKSIVTERLIACGLHQSMAVQAFAHYSEPHRFYHTLEHIEAMLVQRTKWFKLPKELEEQIDLAICLHDVIYDPMASDNEERSAALAVDWLAMCGIGSEKQERVASLILATKKHAHDEQKILQTILLDLDLGILGASPQAYAKYASQIRQEYAYVPIKEYELGRREVVSYFMDLADKGHLYKSEPFKARNTFAYQNLKSEYDQLIGLCITNSVDVRKKSIQRTL